MSPSNNLGRWKTAIGPAGAGAESARAELGSIHWYPIYAYLRAAGLDSDEAAARAESVLARFIDEHPPEGVGTLLLRDWLKQLAAESLAEPENRPPVLTIPRGWAANRYAQETPRLPDETFARRWTMDLIEGALVALETEYRAAGRPEVFTEGQAMLGFSGGPQGDDSYAALAGKLGTSSGAARKSVFELRSRYRELLHASIADTVALPEQISGELSALLVELPPPAATAPPRSMLRKVNPEELLARGMNSVKMSTAGGLGWTPPSVDEAGRLFHGYEVIAMLGHGGMGAVYQARQTSLDRLVAIKLLPLEISVDPSFADRFRREARAMAKLNHPNIISVHDFGQTQEGHLFFVMEFVDGAMLHDLIHQKEASLTPVDSLVIVEQVCDALAYAHEQGVVHRDIKPANVMVDRRLRAKVADFGLARLTDPASKEEWGMTMTGIVMGTPDYMAPEQKRGLHVDHRADIYSVGVMFYEMLCKETPQGAFELPSRRCGIDPRIDTIITKALATLPERRYQNTLELKTAVLAVRPSVIQASAHRSPVAVPAPAVPLAASPRAGVASAAAKPAKKPLSFAIAAAVLAIAGLAIYLLSRDPGGLTEAELAASRKLASENANPPPAAAASGQSQAVPPKPDEQIEASASETPRADRIAESAANVGASNHNAAGMPAKDAVAAQPAAAPPQAPPPASTPAPTPPTPVAAIEARSPPASKAAVEVVQWVTENHGTFTDQWRKEAIEPFDAAVKQLRTAYVAGVERAIATNSKAGKLDESLAWRNERARLESGQDPREIADDEKEPPALRKYRENWRKSFARLDAERFARAKAVHARFDSLLEKAQTGYTQRQRFDDALLARTTREDITKAWLVPAYDPQAASGSKTHSENPPATPANATASPSNDELLSGRDAVLHLRSIGFYVGFRQGDDGPERLVTHNDDPNSIPARGKFEITGLTTPGLRRIDGSPSPITDADFEQLAAMRWLRTFEFKCDTITGAGLKFLAGSPDLETAILASAGLTDAAIEPLLAHRKIKVLAIHPSSNGIDLSRLADAAFLGEVEDLRLDALQPGDKLIAALPKLRKVRSLLIAQGKSLDRDAVNALATLPNLERASLASLSAAAAPGLAGFEKAPKLTRLELPDCDALDALAFIGKMRKLEHLVLDADDAPGLAAAAGAPALRVVEFSGFGAAGDDRALSTIAKAFPRLEKLDAGPLAHHFTPSGIKELAALPKLSTLAWAKKPVPREILAAIAALPQLETLDINGTGVAEDDLSFLAASKSISTLVLMFNSNISARCAEQLKGMAKLRNLALYATSVKAADLPAMQKALPRVTISIQ